jgi:hypothetical protein
VTEKVKDSSLPKPIKGLAAKGAAKAASKMVTPSVIAEKMAKKLCKTLPKKMSEKGLTVEVKPVFCEGPYVVLQLQVQHVDTLAVEKSQSEKNADLTKDDDASKSSFAGLMLEWSLKLIGQKNQKKLEEDFLPQQVQEKLKNEMAIIMAEKFEEKQLTAEVEILKEDKQARYFYLKLQEVKAAKEEKEGKNPIKTLMMKMSSGDNDESDSDDSP